MGAQSTKLIKEVARDSKCVLPKIRIESPLADRPKSLTHAPAPARAPHPWLAGRCCRARARGRTSSWWRGACRWRRSWPRCV